MSEHIYEDSDMEHERYHVIPFGWMREQIVRCRDCKWLRVDMSDHEYRSGYWCGMGRFDPKLDGFCAWGERREQ